MQNVVPFDLQIGNWTKQNKKQKKKPTENNNEKTKKYNKRIHQTNKTWMNVQAVNLFKK
jgi:hypothetical protein